jgi:nitronate monooxygenase
MPSVLKQIGVDLPIIQAPMAGTSTPALAAAVCNAGGLGSIGVGAVNAAGGREMIESVLHRHPYRLAARERFLSVSSRR